MNKKIKSERAIIGGLLVKPELYDIVRGNLYKEDFFDLQCGKAWDLIKKQHEEFTRFDAISLMDAGIDAKWVGEITTDAAYQDTIQFHVNIVRDASNLRNLYRIFDNYRNICRIGEKNATEVISGLQRDILASIRNKTKILDQKEILGRYTEDCRSRLHEPANQPPLGVATGLEEIDRLLVFQGIARGHITTVGAPTSTGKSAFAQAVKRNASLAGEKVLVCTLEDSSESNVKRDMSSLSGIHNMQLQRNTMKPTEWSKFQEAANKINNSKGSVHYIDDYPDSIDDLLSSVEHHYQAKGIDLVIFDYLQLVPAGQVFQKRQQEIDFIFSRIIAWTKQHKDVAVLLVTQMARHEGQPQLNKLYHSAALEQGSHSVILIWNPEVKGWPKMEMGPVGKFELDCRVIDIAKQKDGPVGMVILGWDGKTVSFYNQKIHLTQDYKGALGI